LEALAFFEGMARMLDLGVIMVVYNDSPTPEEADNRPLDSDWRAVGHDIEGAMALYVEKDR
jgi:hypothetical protein